MPEMLVPPEGEAPEPRPLPVHPFPDGNRYYVAEFGPIREATIPGNGLLCQAQAFTAIPVLAQKAWYNILVWKSQEVIPDTDPPQTRWGGLQMDRSASWKAAWNCPACCAAIAKLFKKRAKELTGEEE